MPVNEIVAKRRGKAKVKISEKRKVTKALLKKLKTDDLDVSLALIQELIPIGLQAVAEQLQNEVKLLTGDKYAHGKDNVRWGSQAGSVYLRDQKFPIDVPRVRNKKDKTEIPLEAYQKLQRVYQNDHKTFLKIIDGISMRKYKECSELIPEAFGISASNLSKRFKKSTTELVQRLKRRSLSLYDFICIFIDGKRYAKDGILVVLGVTITGEKVILDIEHSHTENSLVINQLFDRLIKRGLKFEDGLLFIVDGAKGFTKSINERFKEYAFIQRCQWHKRENVISYLDKPNKEIFKRRIQLAYQKTTYKEAKTELMNICCELAEINQSAAGSLKEGFEETLTLHKLGLSSELRKSLSTTNCIESVMSQLAQYTDRVDKWHNSYQLIRWTAAALLKIEPCLNKISKPNYLSVLHFKIKEEIKIRQEKKYGKQNQQDILGSLLV
jgi:putative transposase